MKLSLRATILLTACVLALGGCGGSSHPHPRLSASPGTRTPSAPVTAPGSTRAAHSLGGPVPPGAKATSVTFISPVTAFVLGTAPCRLRPCSVILRTQDRGRSWVGLPAPRESVSSFLGNGLWGIRFADAEHGYAYGDGFWETADGGHSWRPAAAPARLVLALAAVQDRELVAVAARCLPGENGCSGQLGLYQRPIGAGQWTPVARTSWPPFGPGASVAVSGGQVWALAGTELYGSTDGGKRFAARSQPCHGPNYGVPFGVTGDGDHAYILCVGGAAAGSSAKYVFRSVGTSGWALAGQPSRGGDGGELSAGSDQGLVIATASGASDLYRSADAGRTWRTNLTEIDGGAGWADLGFTTPALGVVVHGPATRDGANNAAPGQLLLTEDAGRTWHPVAF